MTQALGDTTSSTQSSNGSSSSTPDLSRIVMQLGSVLTELQSMSARLRDVTTQRGSTTRPATRAKSSGPAWMQQPLSRVPELRARADRTEVPERAREAINALLAVVESEAPRSEQVLARLRGDRVERVWEHLHAAERVLIEHLPPNAAVTYKPMVLDQLAADPARWTHQVAAVTAIEPTGAPKDAGAVLAQALQAVRSRSASRHRSVRSYRNALFLAGILTTAAVLMLVVLGAVSPAALPMCSAVEPASCLFGSSPAGPHVAVVATVGLAAGLLAGVPALRRLRGAVTPYSVPTALLVLKAPCGALSAILGVLLVRSIGLTGDLFSTDTAAGLLAWAVVFGASQQLLTQMADKRAEAVLGAVSPSGTTTAV